MAKILFEFMIPAAILLPVSWWFVRKWYLKLFPATVKRQNELKRASAKYEKQLKKGK